jgi:hypothetical protein
MDKVYIVESSSGSYADYRTHIEGVYASKKMLKPEKLQLLLK